MFFLHRKHLAKRNFCTQTAYRSFYAAECFSHKPFRTKKNCTTIFTDRRFLHTESSPHRGLTHRRFYGFTRRIVYIQTFLHTDVFTQTQTAHRNLCTQHAFTYNQFLHRQALFPLFDRLPFVSPLSGTYLPASKHTDRQTDRKTDRPTTGQRDRHICIYAYMHTCIHKYMHTCIHAYIYIHACIYMHMYIGGHSVRIVKI
jgi:hypothetical protein